MAKRARLLQNDAVSSSGGLTVKTIAMLVLCAFAGAASAQTPAPAPSTDPSPRTANDNPSMRDPRACLEFPTRQQVIACAEKYRQRRPVSKS
jgi:hypothetical protein